MTMQTHASGFKPADFIKLHNRLFRVLDKNHDGKLSREELKKAGVLERIGATAQNGGFDKTYEKMDADHSGDVSFDESQSFFGGIMGANPAAAVMISMIVSEEERKEKSQSPEEAESEEDEAKAKAKPDPDDPDAERLKAKGDRLNSAHNAALAAYALQQTAVEDMQTVVEEAVSAGFEST